MCKFSDVYYIDGYYSYYKVLVIYLLRLFFKIFQDVLVFKGSTYIFILDGDLTFWVLVIGFTLLRLVIAFTKI